MSTSYIIKFRKESDPSYTDAHLTISTKYNFSTITINTEINTFNPNNKTLLYVYIYAGISLSFNDILTECYLDNSIIKFDSNSSSAWTNFKTSLDTIINTENEIQKYPSGNIMYIGQVINKKNTEIYYNEPEYKKLKHGTGTEFYDELENNIMYSGEFENGLYDGSGIFYSLDKKMSIKVNNIGGGIPILHGEVTINYKDYESIININFYDIWKRLNIHKSNEKIIELVHSDRFVDTIARLVWDYKIPFEECKFESLSVYNKQNLLFKKFKQIEEYIIKHNYSYMEDYDRLNTTIYATLFLLASLAFLFFISLDIKK
jgi:hypothetical protein